MQHAVPGTTCCRAISDDRRQLSAGLLPVDIRIPASVARDSGLKLWGQCRSKDGKQRCLLRQTAWSEGTVADEARLKNMRSRQRKTITLEVNDRQRAVLERNIEALPRDTGVEPERTGSDLPALFYHPNTAARVLALVVSAGYDVARGRTENAEKKVNRAIEVFTLVTDDETGRGHLTGLAERLGNESTEFLPLIHETLVPFLQERIGQVEPAAAPVKKATAAMPRAVEDGEALPEEKRRNPKKPAATPKAKKASPPEPEAAATQVADEAPVGVVAESDVVVSHSADTAPDSSIKGNGPSAAEAAAAAAAALAAIEAPYEDVVQDDSAPRFDPDRDLEPSDGRRRRRRSKSPVGLERMKPDQRPDLEMTTGEDSNGPAPSDVSNTESATLAVEELCRASRHGTASDVVDLALEVLSQLLRKTGNLEVEGRVKLEMVLTTADGNGPPQRRRRRRRRRSTRSDG